MQVLPRFFVLQSLWSRKGYLSLTENVPTGAARGFLKFDAEEVLNPHAKFAVERAETGNGLVHIRCCYNNKYWVAEQIQGHSSLWIVATADKPEEDQTKSSCTLFELVFEPESRVRIRNVRAGRFTHESTLASAPETLGGFYVAAGSPIGDAFKIIDWEELVILPQRVSFISAQDGKYLASKWIDRRPYQMFEPNRDVGDPLVAKELFVNADGSLRIKDGHYNKFWRRSPNWIWADAEDDNHSNDTLFWPVKVDDKTIALRNLGNNNFCGGLTTEGKTDCLNAHYPTISNQPKLLVEELVLSREIYDIRFRLADSRIYNEQLEEIDTAFAENDSSTGNATITLRFMVKDIRTRTWNNSVSLTFGVKTTLQFSAIPLIFEGKVELSTEISGGHEWGGSTTYEREREVTYSVNVPPLTKMRVTLLASRATCDVPFSYTQRDLLTDGRFVAKPMDDGIYTGINAYRFDTHSVEVRSTIKADKA